MDRVLQFLSDYATSLNYQKLPRDVVHDVKRHIIDAMGCAMGAYFMEPPAIARAHALEVTANPGCTVLGTQHRTAPELAAFANGVMVRYLDFSESSMSKKTGHASDNISAVLAAAEYAGADIRTVITGIVLAYEVQDRLGGAWSSIADNGWDHGVYGALASASGAGKALGLTQGQMANALALAAIPNAATRQTRAGKISMWKGCADANAARNGVFAALLARRGLTGPEEAFEGPYGFLKQLGADLKLPVFGGDNEPFTIKFDKFKNYPCYYDAQCAVQPALELHQVLRGRVDEIEKVEIETHAHALEDGADTQDKWNPTNRETADHSIPYVVAVAITRGTVWLEDFTEERIRDPKLHTLMQKISVRANEAFTRDWPEAIPFRIKVITLSGEQHIREIRYPKGHPKNPLSDLEIEAKFRRLTELIISPAQADTILDRLWHLEEIHSVRDMLTLFTLSPGKAA